MISRYADHAANERTYLAWIRTAISVMIFGFLIEKFDLILSHTVNEKTGEFFQASIAVELLGLVIFITGILITIFATVRFFRYKRYILAEECFLYSVKKTTLFLSSIIVFLSIFLLIYMLYEFEIDIRLGLG
jgi:putative membrane protein